MENLDFQRIILNAHGPFNHGTWKNPLTGVKVGKEEFLSGRSEYICEKFQEFMTRFTPEQISNMSLIDVGSYDGWFAHEIEKKFGFRRIVSSEPRLKNIEKGIAVRNYLKIESKFEINRETLEDINEKFDIVVCIGVLHHVDSVSSVLRKLASICNIGMFIETQIYEPHNLLSKNIIGKMLFSSHNHRVIEPKDLVYLDKSSNIPDVAISGHKYESSYFDGSSNSSQVVELPSIDGLKLNLAANNFTNLLLHTSSKKYGKKLANKSFRVYKATIVSALRSQESNGSSFKEVKQSIYSYERMQFVRILSEKTISDLIKRGDVGIRYIVFIRFSNFVKKVKFEANFTELLQRSFSRLLQIRFEEIPTISVLKYDFKNKFRFEIAKYEVSRGNFDKAKYLLHEVVTSEEADWRSTYRSLFLLYILAKVEKSEFEEFYLSTLKLSNSSFPLEVEQAVLEALGLDNVL